MKTKLFQAIFGHGNLLMILGVVFFTGMFTAQADSPPVVTGVTAAQRPSTDAHPKYVDISYTNSDANFTSENVFVLVSTDSGATWDKVIPKTFIAGSAVGTNVAVDTTPTKKTITWDAGADWDGHYTANCRVRVLANNVGLVLIPPGTYTRGNSIGDSDITDAPPYPVYVSAFYMDANLVSGGLWGLVKGYADANGYTFVHAGSYKALTHPIQTVDWFDAVKWCNARSEREGLTPVYTNTNGTTYKTGEVAPSMNFTANGYRLPTEAEWEKAARGGLNGKRFPWGDTIQNGLPSSGGQANYYSYSGYAYDLGPTGYNSAFNDGVFPYTSPVGSFPPNGYNLYDMAGNTFEWCWDWYSSAYYTSGQTDPLGPVTGSFRISRGSSYGSSSQYYKESSRCASRQLWSAPQDLGYSLGFRCVRWL